MNKWKPWLDEFLEELKKRVESVDKNVYVCLNIENEKAVVQIHSKHVEVYYLHEDFDRRLNWKLVFVK